MHANHYHDAELGSHSRVPPPENSAAREGLLNGFLRPKLGSLTLEDMMAGLRLGGGEHPVCRPRPEDPSAVTTCAAAIICPQRRTMWVAPGNPAETEFEAVYS